ncbi:hypothetical protein, partial [Acidiphilium sp. PM]|uniref:hypothetical protein n=1 Tax=Acidiphilium sp. PM TaxID=1043206 RepID=UPI0019D70938
MAGAVALACQFRANPARGTAGAVRRAADGGASPLGQAGGAAPGSARVRLCRVKRSCRHRLAQRHGDMR